MFDVKNCPTPSGSTGVYVDPRFDTNNCTIFGVHYDFCMSQSVVSYLNAYQK